LLAHYYPDFLVKVNNSIYLVETKAERDLNNPDVLQKRKSTLEWIEKINQLNEIDRDNSKWKYVLLGEKTFETLTENGANTKELLEYALMTRGKVKGTLEDYL